MMGRFPTAAVLRRLVELVTNPQGKLSTTDTATMTALAVSSVALIICVLMDRQPDAALGLYLGAWVTHAGVQVHQKTKVKPERPVDENRTD